MNFNQPSVSGGAQESVQAFEMNQVSNFSSSNPWGVPNA